MGIKVAGAWGWPHHLRVPNVMKSGSLNLLEPSEPHRACYGTPLPLREMYTESHWVTMSFVKGRLCVSHTLINGVCPYFLRSLSVLGELQYQWSARDASEQVSIVNIGAGKAAPFYGLKRNFIDARILKPRGILEVKNALLVPILRHGIRHVQCR